MTDFGKLDKMDALVAKNPSLTDRMLTAEFKPKSFYRAITIELAPGGRLLEPNLVGGVHAHKSYWLHRQRAKDRGVLLTTWLDVQYTLEDAMYETSPMYLAITGLNRRGLPLPARSRYLFGVDPAAEDES